VAYAFSSEMKIIDRMLTFKVTDKQYGRLS